MSEHKDADDILDLIQERVSQAALTMVEWEERKRHAETQIQICQAVKVALDDTWGAVARYFDAVDDE